MACGSVPACCLSERAALHGLRVLDREKRICHTVAPHVETQPHVFPCTQCQHGPETHVLNGVCESLPATSRLRSYRDVLTRPYIFPIVWHPRTWQHGLSIP